jgi:HEPN domain-containing protein
MKAVQPPLSNLQIELLKVFSRNVSDEDILEIRRLLTRYFADKAIEAANKVWDEKGWTDEDAERMLHTHMRTPYQQPISKTQH